MKRQIKETSITIKLLGFSLNVNEPNFNSIVILLIIVAYLLLK